MTLNETIDRAEATVWLPLLHILGGVAERVARRRSDDFPVDKEKAAVATAAGPEEGR